MIQHSGFIALDIDANDNPEIVDWEDTRDKLAFIQNVYFTALSVSGKGVFLVVPISYPEKHEQHFDALRKDFQEELGYIIDKSCRDVSRLRGMSYDPDARINNEAIPYKRIHKRFKISPERKIGVFTERLDYLIWKIVRSGIDITDGYENWVQVGRALVNEYGEAGREYFHLMSQQYPSYNYEECDRQYDACIRSPGSATGGTIFYIAKQYGITLNSK